MNLISDADNVENDLFEDNPIFEEPIFLLNLVPGGYNCTSSPALSLLLRGAVVDKAAVVE